MKERVEGMIVGLAAGDKNHGPSHMVLQLAESLVARQRFDPDDVFERYLAWHRQGASDTGTVAGTVFDHATAGVAPRDAVWRTHQELDGKTAGVNPAHRVAPLAAAAFLDDHELGVAARLESALTHAHPVAGETAAAVAILCRRLIRGDGWDEALGKAATGKPLEVVLALQPALTTIDDLSLGGFAPEVLRTAIWPLHHSFRFADAISASLDFAGAANYSPVLVGAIGGARWGAEAVPEAEVDGNPVAQALRQVAEALASGW